MGQALLTKSQKEEKHKNLNLQIPDTNYALIFDTIVVLFLISNEKFY